MSDILWTKTMLSLLRRLPNEVINVNTSVDALIRRTMFSYGDTIKEIEELRQLLLHKKNVQYIIDIIKEAYRDIDNENRHILLDKHYHNKTFKEIAVERKVSLRSVFRWYDVQVEAFDKALSRLGYDDEYLDFEFGADKLIGREYRYQKTQENRERSVAQTKIIYRIDQESVQKDSEVLEYSRESVINKYSN